MFKYVDIHGKGYTEQEANMAERKHLDIPDVTFELVPISEAIANGQSVTLVRDVEQLVDPAGQDTIPEEEMVVSVSKSGFIIEWNDMEDELPTYRIMQLLSYCAGWLLMVSDEDTSELGVAATWFSFRQFKIVVDMVEQYGHLVEKNN